MPSISVIVPVFNGERYLREAIQSILAQHCPASEVIVIDDGSTDESAQLARGFGAPVRVISQSNRGPGAARNAGVRESTGEFLAFLDADDIWRPSKLTRQAAWFSEHPEVDVVTGQVQNFISPELSPDQLEQLDFATGPLPGMIPGAILARREALIKCGPFSEEIKIGDFIPWFGRARDLQLKIDILPEVVLHRRVHSTNLSQNALRGHDYARALKQMLDRRRIAP